MDAATRALSRPYWLPEDTEFAALPRPLQVAITEILYPDAGPVRDLLGG
jgi:hypothetical protein